MLWDVTYYRCAANTRTGLAEDNDLHPFELDQQVDFAKCFVLLPCHFFQPSGSYAAWIKTGTIFQRDLMLRLFSILSLRLQFSFV